MNIWVAQNLERGSFVASKINDYQRIFILQKRGPKCCLWEFDALGICLIGWCLELVISVNSLPYNTLSHNSLCCANGFVVCAFLRKQDTDICSIVGTVYLYFDIMCATLE
jgi:hypothetical protein